MELVPFETAKKLEDKGFNKPTPLLYNDDGMLEALTDMFAPAPSKNTFYCAPNIYEVMEWLRTEKSLHIRMSVYWIGWCFDITDMNQNSKHIYGSECKYRKFEQAALAGIKYILDNNLI